MNLGSIDPRTASLIDAATRPLDGARSAALAVATKSRSLTRIIARRSVRVPFLACLQIALLFAITATRPLWLFVLGPIVLGVPHLASDLRYLVLRQKVAREVLFVGAAASALLVGLYAAELLRMAPPHVASLQVSAGFACIAFMIASGARERGNRAPLLLLLPLLGLGALGAEHAGLTRILFAHLHNVVGVAGWIILFRKSRRAALFPLVLLVAAVVLLVVASAARLSPAAFESFGFDLSIVARGLAPGLPIPLAIGVALSFVFLQAVHYAAWLVWIPQDNLPGEGTFTFRMTARSLVHDFSIPVLALFGVLAVALAGTAALDAKTAVRAYMGLATFHGWLEVALFAYFAARGGRAKLAA